MFKMGTITRDIRTLSTTVLHLLSSRLAGEIPCRYATIWSGALGVQRLASQLRHPRGHRQRSARCWTPTYRGPH